jgi:hypothetical protein
MRLMISLNTNVDHVECNFDNLGDMQRHNLVEHMQKGDIISEEKEEKNK